jgi:hypothetical protein
LRDIANGRYTAYRNILHKAIGLPVDEPAASSQEPASQAGRQERADRALQDEADILADNARSITRTGTQDAIEKLRKADEDTRREIAAMIKRYTEPPTDDSARQQLRDEFDKAMKSLIDAIVEFQQRGRALHLRAGVLMDKSAAARG